MAKEKTTPQKLCFVVGPIGAEESEVRIHADWLLEEIIQPVMSEIGGFDVKRADQDHRPGLIDAQLINDLLSAELVIADLSSLNPNAFYEIGIRHMAQKPIIHMQLSTETIPFDVSLYRAIKFSRARPRDIRTARSTLKLQVEAVLAPGYQIENPVTNARGRFQLEQHATGEQQVILNRLTAIEQKLNFREPRQATLGGKVPLTIYIDEGLSELERQSVIDRARRLVKNISGGASWATALDYSELLCEVPAEYSNVVIQRLVKLKGIDRVSDR